jgi:hypothetical protein
LHRRLVVAVVRVAVVVVVVLVAVVVAVAVVVVVEATHVRHSTWHCATNVWSWQSAPSCDCVATVSAQHVASGTPLQVGTMVVAEVAVAVVAEEAVADAPWLKLWFPSRSWPRLPWPSAWWLKLWFLSRQRPTLPCWWWRWWPS